MRKVAIPDNAEALGDLDIALKYLNGTYKYELNDSEKQIISNIYQKYDQLLGNIDDEFKSTLLRVETNNALQIAYSEIQLKGRLSSLRSKLLLLYENCPYCGITPISELDHYLPQSIYKATSIYSRNLIPICHICNNGKRTAVNDINGSSFFHAYFEIFPQDSFFITDVKFIDGNLMIDYVIDKTNITDELGAKLDFQFQRTNLKNRLKQSTNNYLFGCKSSIEMIFESDNENGVKKLFIRQYNEFKQRFGVNSWNTSLLLALSNCDDFCRGGFAEYFKKNNIQL
ncbi:HNH endonuclease [Flavobacterium sp. AJR]|uniref:HNH endonuclease n=1 Tax=Flavobacterium sp. AJR TaxID=1979369 RepID=UPI000A3D890B|nr:hypothetical protein [Flavobacterium sp. AJR]OUL60019.1 hypothetical protein B8T70_22590 [Flavobacterium sp. AJR]